MNRQKDIMVVMSTAPPEKSDLLARMLVENHVVACVNVIPVRSYYRWKGEFCDEREHLLVAKTTEEKVKEVIAAIKNEKEMNFKLAHSRSSYLSNQEAIIQTEIDYYNASLKMNELLPGYLEEHICDNIRNRLVECLAWFDNGK